jgi:hypothetical protein
MHLHVLGISKHVYGMHAFAPWTASAKNGIGCDVKVCHLIVV